jgi:hypothetical protein
LCRIIENGQYSWKEKGFIGAICNVCDKPMIVLIDHRQEICPVELQLARMLAEKYFKFLKPCGATVHKKHWNEHYI